MSYVDAEGTRELQLRAQPQLQRRILYLIVGLFSFNLLLIALFAVKTPGVVPWLLGALAIAAAVLVVGNPARRRVRRAELTPTGIVLTTKSGRVYTIAWGQRAVFVDVVVAEEDGTVSPGPVVRWGRLGLPVTRLTLDSANDLVETSRHGGFRISESVSGVGRWKTHTTHIRSRTG